MLFRDYKLQFKSPIFLKIFNEACEKKIIEYMEKNEGEKVRIAQKRF